MPISRQRMHRAFYALGAAEKPDVAAGLSNEVLSQLIEMSAEEHGIDLEGVAPEPSARTRRLADDFAAAVHRELKLWGRSREHMQWFVRGDDADELFFDDAPYAVLMTLRGEGVGIEDGRWDSHFEQKHSSEAIASLVTHLEKRLARWADDSGDGLLNVAFEQDALRTAPTIEEDDDEDEEEGEEDADDDEEDDDDDE